MRLTQMWHTVFGAIGEISTKKKGWPGQDKSDGPQEKLSEGHEKSLIMYCQWDSTEIDSSCEAKWSL